MKKQALTVLALASLLAMGSVVSLHANSFGHKVRADIPFDFIVGNETLLAGTYTAQTLSASTHNTAVLLIQSLDHPTSVFSLTHGVSVARLGMEDNPPKLIFNRYGDRYFLTQVWAGGDIDGRELPKTPREREAGLGD